MQASKESASAEETIMRLQTENLMLRERLAQFEAAEETSKIISSARTSTHSEKEANHQKEDDFSVAVADALPTALRFKKTDLEHYDDLPTYPDRPHFAEAPHHPSTQCVIFDGCPGDPYHPSSMPIYQTSTFVQPNIDEFGPYDYTRSGNPTRTAVEVLVAKLEGAHAAFAFSSGMAALSCLMSTLQYGDHIVAMSDLYGGMHRLMTQVTSRFGIHVSFVDMSNVRQVDEKSVRDEVSAAEVPCLPTLREAVMSVYQPGRSKLIHLESPSNPLMKITNLQKLAQIAHELGMQVSVDNTMMTPARCQPLQLGCDIVMHSGTKFFSGHSDTMCGFLASKDPAVSKRLAFLQNAEGTALAPFDCWLVLRGLKTLCLRVERQEVNAIAVALFLCRQTHFVTRLHFAGVDPRQYGHVASISLPHFLLHHMQTSGPGSVLSFETSDVAKSKRFVNACKLFKLTVSFGSCNSLVEMPCLLSHASIPKEKRTLPDDLVRLAVGIEHVQDLINDLTQAIAAATANSHVDESKTDAN